MKKKILFILLITGLITVFLFPGCRKKGGPDSVQMADDLPPGSRKVLQSRLAGSWYPADAAELKREINHYLEQAGPSPASGVQALILPHAGYAYSGGVAAYGISRVAGRSYSRVVVLGPSHRYYMDNLASLPDATHYATPLGEIPLDLECMDRLRESSLFTTISQVHANEHSVQIHLPFLQVVLGRFRLVPVVVGQLDFSAALRMARALLAVVDGDTLVVISSDFCHYGSNYKYVPFTGAVAENIRSLDMEAFDIISQCDLEGFYAFLDRTGATICGRNPIAVLLAMAGRDFDISLLKYDTSGNITGDFSSSVSYLSIACNGQWKKRIPGIDKKFSLDQQTRTRLLQLARKTLSFYLEHGSRPSPDQLEVEITAAMQPIMGGFVTLEQAGQLRGCTGDIYPRRPLFRVVMDHAVNAAVNDTRFLPVSRQELAELDIEISALTPPEAVTSCKDIIIGRHGIILSKQGHSAVFLPQVAPRQGWGLAETLDHLCLKAGLPAAGWQKGAAFLVFEAIVFSEHEQH